MTAHGKPFRVIHTGVREGRANIAFDSGLIDLHKRGAVRDTIRFLTFRPTALVGRHQALSQEINLDYCRANGIGLGRRMTGGGAIYMDEGQFGFELVFKRETLGLGNLGELAKAICEAAAAGLRKPGVNALYRPRNDIEVDGRKISGTGGFFDGDTLFYQGAILLRLDPARMVGALNVPAAKLAKNGAASAVRRVVTLSELAPEAAADPVRVKAALLEGFAQPREKVAWRRSWSSCWRTPTPATKRNSVRHSPGQRRRRHGFRGRSHLHRHRRTALEEGRGQKAARQRRLAQDGLRLHSRRPRRRS